MRWIVGTAALLLVALLVVLAYLVLVPTEGRLAKQCDELPTLVADERTRKELRVGAVRVGTTAGRLSNLGPIRLGHHVEGIVTVSALRLGLGLAAFPIFCTASLVGLLAGLFHREQLREEFGWHSTTLSYIGKSILALSTAAYAFTGLSPIAPPVWSFYVYSLTALLGGGIYVGNLPPKL